MSFEKLRVYQAAQELRKEVDKLGNVLNIRFAALFGHADDAADSIMNNIAEGSGSIYPRKRISFYDIAIGSAREVSGSLRSLDQRGAFGGASVFRSIVLSLSIIKMLTAMINKLKD